jgi:UDP-N-acetylglucosamine--N-acetylmuramyl-(pentapeptide) pyrophosphoryl-undecaprenol N-acetylglucosamine transferase
MEQIKVCFTGGGTAGHVFPAFEVDQQLQLYSTKNKITYERFWIGSKNKQEKKWVEENQIRHIAINSGKLRRYFSLQTPIDLILVVVGFFQALKVLHKEKPDIIFSKGGFVSVAPIWAARILRIVSVTHESDAIAGLATKLNSYAVKKICIAHEQCRFSLAKSVQHKAIVTGVPSRLKNNTYNKNLVYKKYKFDENLPLTVILGGSLGSKQINDLVFSMLDELTKETNIIHQTGFKDSAMIDIKNYKSFSFIKEELEEILSVATIVVSRAGATVISDYSKMKVPMILIPLSMRSSRGDQIANAKWLLENNAAIVLDSDNINAKILFDSIVQLLRCVKMQQELVRNASSIYIEDSALRCVQVIIETLKGRRVYG